MCVCAFVCGLCVCVCSLVVLWDDVLLFVLWCVVACVSVCPSRVRGVCVFLMCVVWLCLLVSFIGLRFLLVLCCVRV